jgi:hypothetical protein
VDLEEYGCAGDVVRETEGVESGNGVVVQREVEAGEEGQERDNTHLPAG